MIQLQVESQHRKSTESQNLNQCIYVSSDNRTPGEVIYLIIILAFPSIQMGLNLELDP